MDPATGCSATTAGGSTVKFVRYAADASHPFHAHDYTTITLILNGGLEETVGHARERAGPLSMVVKPAGVAHADRFGARGATTLQILLSPEDETGARLTGHALECWRWIHVSEAVRPMLALVSRLRSHAVGAPTVDDLLAETLAAIDPPIRSHSSGPPAWLVEARQALAARPVSIRELSCEAGVHPIHLAREFRRHFGVPPTCYRGRMRVWRAAELLSRETDPLVSVALEVGFADQAHMTHAFQAATGVTPNSLRRLSRSATSVH